MCGSGREEENGLVASVVPVNDEEVTAGNLCAVGCGVFLCSFGDVSKHEKFMLSHGRDVAEVGSAGVVILR